MMARALMLFVMISVIIHLSRGQQVPSTPACPNPIQVDYGTGCVCTGESCGELPESSKPPSTGEALVITTSQQDGFFKREVVSLDNEVEDQGQTASMDITVDPTTTYQEIYGFGVAITDAVAYVLTEVLSNEANLSNLVLQQAFDQANFTMARVPMNSADFSRMNYAMAHELDLSDFCLRDDRTPDGESVECGQDYKLDTLQQAMAYQPDLKLYVSSWSAPPSFKHQNFTCTKHRSLIHCVPGGSSQMDCIRTVSDPVACVSQAQSVPCETTPPHDYQDGFPLDNTLSPLYNPDTIPRFNSDGNCYNQGFILPEAYQSWADHYAKFIEAYTNASVPVWGITSQNEPLMQTGLWQSNFWTADDLATFVNDFLAPAVRRVQPDIKVMVYDDQYLNLTDFASQVAQGDASDGISFHWYNSLESIYENDDPRPSSPIPFDLPLVGGGAGVKTLYDEFNGEKFMLMSEACNGYAFGTDYVGPQHGSFAFGYNMAHDLLWNLRNRAAGYVLWNLILTDYGGPNLAGNFVDSPMYALNETAFVQNPVFFYFAHFSRTIPVSSMAVKADVQCGASYSEYCQYVAFKTPNDDLVIVMTNDEVTTDIIAPLPMPRLARGEGAPIEWEIKCEGSTVRGIIPWKSIQTVVMPCGSDTSDPSPTTSSASSPVSTTFATVGAQLVLLVLLHAHPFFVGV